MSEPTKTYDNRATIRWKLLTGASALALATYVSSADQLKAEDAGQPPIWIELDGQFSLQRTDVVIFAPAFLAASPFDAGSRVGLEKAPPTIWNKGAKISFEPSGSDWVLSLGVRYGKNARSETVNHQTPHGTFSKYGYTAGFHHAYQMFKAQSAENHTVIDFQAGKDVGLGKFGSGGSSELSAGVRIAQFNSRGAVEIQSQPANLNAYSTYHFNKADFDAKRRFTGIGPSLSWDASANIAGNSSSSTIALDWGINAAVLFGRQRATVHHQTTNNLKHHYGYISSPRITGASARSKNVTVPNLGGFAGVSWRYANAKVNLGYRADMFFGAMDGGIDARKNENRGFFGPFASISVAVGD